MASALQRAQSGAWLPQALQARRENLRKAASRLTQQIDRLTQAYLEQIVSLAEYRRRRQDLDSRVAAIHQQIDDVELHVDRQQELQQVAAHVEDFRQRVSSGLATATFEQQRHLVELLIDRIVVTDEEVEIRYVIPTTPRSEHIHFYHLRSDYSGTPESNV